MSSPQVLTFSEAPLEQARAGNREECLHYLEQAQQVWRQLGARTQALAARGVSIATPPHPSLEQAELEMWARFGEATDGAEALRYIHHYYQSLKHPWTEQLDAADRDFAEKSRQEIEEAAEHTRLREIEQHLALNSASDTARAAAEADAARLQVTAESLTTSLAGAKSGTSAAALKAGQWIAELGTEEKIRARVSAIVATARTDGEHAHLRAQIEGILRGDPALAVAHLEHLRLVRNRELEEERRRAVEAELRARQAADLREALAASLAGCEPLLASLPARESAARRAELEAALSLCDQGDTARAENAFEQARRALTAAAARRPAVVALVRELRRLGYEEVTPMETITAADVNAHGVSTIQLGLPADPERLAEISFTADASTVAVQAVRTTPTTGTAEQRAADVAAQTALCADVDAARAAAGVRAFNPQELSREAPGKPMPARTAKVRRGGVFAKSRAAASSAARLHARSP